MINYMVDLKTVQEEGPLRSIDIQADSIEALLMGFLGDIVLEDFMVPPNMIPCRFDLKITSGDGKHRLHGQS